MSIRIAIPSDLETVRTCARKAYAHYVPRIGREPAPMVADFSQAISAERLHVMEVDGSVAGFIVFYPRDDHVHIENVAVAPDFQGHGIGTKLVAFAEAEAARLGYRRIELYTNAAMTENFCYYAAIGYREIARRTEDGFRRVYFEKLLSQS